jgi:hypothetical protein
LLDGETLIARFEGGREYLKTLASPPWKEDGWAAGYARFKETAMLDSSDPRCLPLSTTMALCHPAWWKDRATTKDILIGDQFEKSAIQNKCQAELLWGYECPFNNAPVHQDHWFPKALGGATVPNNRLVLCEHHNYLKGTDIHPYPWDQPRKSWVDEVIARIANYY